MTKNMSKISFCLLVAGVISVSCKLRSGLPNKLVIGVLMDGNYGGVESLSNFIKRKLGSSILEHTELEPSETLMNETGGLLHNIEYFRSVNAKVILDLQRSDNVDTLAHYLRVPVVSMIPQWKLKEEYVISMYPNITVVNSAIVEFLLRYQIVNALLLYDKRRSRQATNLHTKCQKNYIKIEMMPELEMDDIKMIKEVIKMAWVTQIKTVVLLCHAEDVKSVVKASLQSRLYDKDRKNWKWIVGDMDFQKLDYDPLEGFVGFSLPEPQGNAKQLVSFNNGLVAIAFNKKIYSEVFYATILDGIRVIQQGLSKLNLSDPDAIDGKAVFKAITNTSLPSCGLYKNGDNCGLTGKLQFDEKGDREIDDMDFVIVKDHKMDREWKWNSNPHRSVFPPRDEIRWVGHVVENYLCYETRDKEPMKKKRKNFTIIVMGGDKPFVFVNQSDPNREFQGFAIDIVEKLKTILDFDYHFVIKSGGSGKKVDGKWNGLVGALMNQEADLAVGSFTITADREGVIDFSKPFMDFRTALIVKVPEEETNLFNFHKPFSIHIWIMVVMAVFGMTFLLYVVDYFSPLGYRKTAENDEEGQEFNIMNSLWFATASMLQQGGDNTPKAPSGRILASAFWFFILIIISTYTANLAAFFTNKKIDSPIKSLEDLVYRSNMKYNVLTNGQLYNFLQKSGTPLHNTMFSHVRNQEKITSSKDGVKKARKGGFAYISETPILQYHNNLKPCNTMVVDNLLDVKSYGFGLPKNSEFTNELSVAILKLREDGYIERKRKYWWEEKSQCEDLEPAPQTVTLNLASLGGVFIVMIAGIVISFLLLAIEVKFKWIIDLFLKAQENRPSSADSHREPPQNVMRVEITQGEHTLNRINRAEPRGERRNWLPTFGSRR